ncbi:venom allergen 5-like [Spodoptera litura]|uniref:Venom allergen 5-like n=1 Tax=Spodoptera litura TaxID=69820 RepID=A0A9J7IUG5_SPOLT|nr:venom allergen 5-like [Spodoptera litura]
MTHSVRNKVKCGKLIYYNEMFGVLVVLSCVLALAATREVNYCGASMCGNTNAHTFCQYPKGPSAKCEGYIHARLRGHEKKTLLARFNSYRASAARGAMLGFPASENMLKLQWMEPLAREAQRWADQCRPPRRPEEHDTCRDLYSLKVGQCVASVVGDTPIRVEQLTDIWYIQNIFYNYSVNFYVPPRNDSTYYGDFAQIFWSNSYMVGCGRSRFMAPWQGRVQLVERLVCNVAPYGPQATQAIWSPGAPATHCPRHSRPSFKGSGLCVYAESRREVEKALEQKERDLQLGKRKKKVRKVRKVRRELPDYDDTDENDEEIPTTLVNRWTRSTTTAKSVHPLMALIKLIPSMADYPDNFPKEVIDIVNTASCLSPSLFIVLALFL